jgi:hypothetical protein
MPILRLAFLLCLIPQVSRAEDRDAALRLVREGNALVGRGNCTSALDRFQRAKAAFPASHKVEVNIGTALECLGRVAEATAHFELFLEHVDAGHAMFGSVRAKVMALRARTGRIAVRCPGVLPGRVIVDGVESPLAGRAYAEPGSHRIVVVCGALRRTEEMQLAAGAQREVQVLSPASQPRPSPTPASRPSVGLTSSASSLTPPPPVVTPTRSIPTRPFYKRWWFWSIVGVAVVGATVGVVAATTGGSDRMPRGEMGHISVD